MGQHLAWCPPGPFAAPEAWPAVALEPGFPTRSVRPADPQPRAAAACTLPSPAHSIPPEMGSAPCGKRQKQDAQPC